MTGSDASHQILSCSEPDPVEALSASTSPHILLICEHAGNMIPQELQGLGLDDEHLLGHIAWDIGAGALTRRIAENLGAACIMQRYSRLVIDCNRPPDAPDSIPEQSDMVPIPGNVGLTDAQRAARVAQIFDPFHDTVTQHIDSQPVRAAVAIHSFTPSMAGQDRPWDIGLLSRRHTATSAAILDYLRTHHSRLNVGINQPYRIEDSSDWFVPRHAEPRGLPHSLVEIRNDHIADSDGQDRWANIMTGALTHAFAQVAA